MKKPLATLLICAAAAIVTVPSSASAADSPATDTRYVWVNNLTLRAAPDAKAEALARLPLGASLQVLPATLPLVHREESIAGLKLDHAVAGKPLKIVGDWRHVRAGTMDGWVFDGYLSRYPYPKATQDSDKVAMEFATAKKLFGARSEQQWMTGDATNSDIFRAMPKRLQDESQPDNHAAISWERVAFVSGGQGELAIDTHEAGEGWTVSLDKLPMTYQEALLWARRWGWAGNYGAVLEDGRTELRFDFDETKSDMEYTIACAGQTCSIQYSYAKE
jgi:hypothetical protein